MILELQTAGYKTEATARAAIAKLPQEFEGSDVWYMVVSQNGRFHPVAHVSEKQAMLMHVVKNCVVVCR